MGEWISVKDKLPEEDQYVTFASLYRCGDTTEVEAVASGQFWDNSFHLNKDGLEAENVDGYAEIHLDFKPTHWLPLPAFPAIEE